MTHKERLLAACRGERPDRIAWVPRLDIWYNANLRAGTLPTPYRGQTLREITTALGLGYHAVVPDMLNLRSADDSVDRCLGIFRLKEMPFETRLRGVEREVSTDGDMTRVTYHTPAGSVWGSFSYTEEMRRAGTTISWIHDHVLKRPEDSCVLEHIFSNLEVVPAADGYDRWREWVGEDGLAVAHVSAAAGPMQHIMRDLLPMTDFFLWRHDYPDVMAALARSMEPWYRAIVEAALDSNAEVLYFGSNYDDAITYPPFFEDHILPWLKWASELAHGRGKLLLTHTDGENERLLALYRRAGFDVADSICPAPMTNLTLSEYVEALPEVTIWGGIPSVALLPESMPEADFERLVDETLVLAAGRPRLILSVADTLPPNASFERFLHITRRVRAA